MDNNQKNESGEVDIVDALDAVSVIAKWLAGVLRKVREHAKSMEQNQ